MTDKPSYLGLLNAISNAETDAGKYFTAWADTTPDPEVEKVIRTVALREAEHGLAFAKRINELGFAVRPKEDPEFEAKMAMLSRTDISDIEKFACIGYRPGETRDDPFARFMDDRTMDIATSALMGRYIGEERDSGRLLAGCLAALCAAEAKKSGNGHDAVTLEAVCAEIADIKSTLADLADAIASIGGTPGKAAKGKRATSH
ncbi:MAG: hypothetical protein VYB54_08470 [Pseudomonadota bacterium]|nr:hypothetical protein [Pseudomonadota bacterium]